MKQSFPYIDNVIPVWERDMFKVSTLILLISGLACSSSIPKKQYEDFFKLHVFRPKDISHIAGLYQHSSGLGGEKLILKSDNTFFYDNWRDLMLINLESQDRQVKGISGEYYFSGDTLTLMFKSMIYTDSLFNQNELNRQQILNNKTQLARLSSIYSPSFLIEYKSNIFLIPLWRKQTLRENYSQFDDFLQYDLYEGKKVGKSLLIKSE